LGACQPVPPNTSIGIAGMVQPRLKNVLSTLPVILDTFKAQLAQGSPWFCVKQRSFPFALTVC
jgi:hypothetical protein